MKEKKTAVITFRCTEAIKERLEHEADKYAWSISQLAEKIIIEHVLDQKEIEEEQNRQAKEIYDYIMKTNCSNPITLLLWATENNCTEELTNSYVIWKDILEWNKKKEQEQ